MSLVVLTIAVPVKIILAAVSLITFPLARSTIPTWTIDLLAIPRLITVVVAFLQPDCQSSHLQKWSFSNRTVPGHTSSFNVLPIIPSKTTYSALNNTNHPSRATYFARNRATGKNFALVVAKQMRWTCAGALGCKVL